MQLKSIFAPFFDGSKSYLIGIETSGSMSLQVIRPLSQSNLIGIETESVGPGRKGGRALNRTLLELKQAEPDDEMPAVLPLNRTLLELKLHSQRNSPTQTFSQSNLIGIETK